MPEQAKSKRLKDTSQDHALLDGLLRFYARV